MTESGFKPRAASSSILSGLEGHLPKNRSFLYFCKDFEDDKNWIFWTKFVPREVRVLAFCVE